MFLCRRSTGRCRDQTWIFPACRIGLLIRRNSGRDEKAFYRVRNRDHDMTPELDAGFAALAAQRVRSAPMRYYVWLPALRIADMWLRSAHRIISLGSPLVGVQRRSPLAGRQLGLWCNQFVLCCYVFTRDCSQPYDLWYRPIRFLSAATFGVPGQPGKSRAPLHAWMLIPLCYCWLQRCSVVVNSFQIWNKCLRCSVFKRFKTS